MGFFMDAFGQIKLMFKDAKFEYDGVGQPTVRFNHGGFRYKAELGKTSIRLVVKIKDKSKVIDHVPYVRNAFSMQAFNAKIAQLQRDAVAKKMMLERMAARSA